MRNPRVAAVIGAVVLPLLAGLSGAAASPGTTGAAGAPAAYRGALADAAYTCPHLPPGLQAAVIDVESGWDAVKEGPNGTQGLAQLSPRMWALWGRDADHDGENSPRDSADAIDAQARLLCQLYRQAVQSPLRGDRLSLTLAAYRLGWTRLQQAGGLGQLPTTREYVAEVKGLAPHYADGLGVTNNSRSLYTPLPNPRTPAGAVTWARSMVGDDGWLSLCLNFMARAYGWNHSGTRYAIDHWLFTPESMRHHRQRNAPVGALMFWDTGLRPGHVAISLGNGYVATNDVITPGRISIVQASTIDARWNARYLGWTPPYFPDGV
ncbi:lytic transglycosylase domain-containing protein [Sporichthya polymorpha]|uniref:lytic transglycosylase domain-containing protein n=1 Tax=Sporichthya polymorpha TaxID=35751 RepID=UPI0006851766|nr:lytic transglycosylase domain-containing protein [Sporichthya polymorpha]